MPHKPDALFSDVAMWLIETFGEDAHQRTSGGLPFVELTMGAIPVAVKTSTYDLGESVDWGARVSEVPVSDRLTRALIRYNSELLFGALLLEAPWDRIRYDYSLPGEAVGRETVIKLSTGFCETAENLAAEILLWVEEDRKLNGPDKTRLQP
jgi:hypothetical protein